MISNNEMKTEKITVNLKELSIMLSCGTRCADMIGENANAIIRIGAKKLYKVEKIKDYINKTDSLPGVNAISK